MFERSLKISERLTPTEEPCTICGEMKVEQAHLKAFEFTDPVALGRVKPHQDWQRFLQRMKKANPGSADFNTY